MALLSTAATTKPPDQPSLPAPFRPPPNVVATGFEQIRSSYGGRRTKPATEDGGVFTCIVWGSKDGGKSRLALGFPKPKGSRTVIVTYDHTTIKSLRNSFGEGWMERHNATVYKPTAADPASGYRGYNKSDPQTAVECWAETMGILQEERDRGDVGILLMDHFQLFYSGVCSDFAYAVKRVDPLTGQLQFSDWNIRTKAAQAVDELVRTCPMDGGAAFITGYGEQEGYVQEKDPATGKSVVKLETKWPNWLGRNGEISRDWLLAIELNRELVRRDGVETPRYLAKVVGSKMTDPNTGGLFFPIGMEIDWTGGTIATLIEKAQATNPALAAKVTA
jgi:hypothetical protein